MRLVELRHAGLIGLPRLAEVFIDANRRLAASSSADDGFRRSYGGSGPHGGPSSGMVYGPWTTLRDTVQTVLGNTANNVITAGQVLNEIAEAYACRDAEAAAELQRLWENRDIDETDPGDVPPGSLPEPIFPE
ncbi:MAG TPA: hypothetical protein VIL37_07365 [Natronosporangium sp.]